MLQSNVSSVLRAVAIILASRRVHCVTEQCFDAGVDEGNSSWTCPTPSPPGECEGSEDSDDSDEVPSLY